jgi:predicted ribosome quality control (RQC) complex YloA/Tae2 family protein
VGVDAGVTEPALPQALTREEVEALARTLNEALQGGQVQQIRSCHLQAGRSWWRIRTRGQNHWLQVALVPAAARVLRVAGPGPGAAMPAGWVQLLRAHLVPARILGVEAPAGDRTLRLGMSTGDGARWLTLQLWGMVPSGWLHGDRGEVLGVWPPHLHAQAAVRVDAPPSSAGLPDGDVPTLPFLPGPQDAAPGSCSALETALEARLQARETLRAEAGARTDMLARLRSAIRTLQRRLHALEGDLLRVDEAGQLRRDADLLSAQRHAVARGASEVELTDWFAEGAPVRRVRLDPARPLQEQIDRLYHQARRRERGADRVLERLERTGDHLAAMLALQAQALAGPGLPSATVFETLQTEAGIARRERAPGRRPTATASRLPWRCFPLCRGGEPAATVLVGRGARDNERLTFQRARGRDVWLHAMDWPGAHVVLVRSWGDGDPPGDLLQQAALLTAWFSEGRRDGVVTVQWTERRHVRKVPGAAPGRVSVAGGRTLDVRMDDARLPQLLSTEGSTRTGEGILGRSRSHDGR